MMPFATGPAYICTNCLVAHHGYPFIGTFETDEARESDSARSGMWDNAIKAYEERDDR
jgi:hypothetical protein